MRIKHWVLLLSSILLSGCLSHRQNKIVAIVYDIETFPEYRIRKSTPELRNINCYRLINFHGGDYIHDGTYTIPCTIEEYDISVGDVIQFYLEPGYIHSNIVDVDSASFIIEWREIIKFNRFKSDTVYHDEVQ